MRPNSAAASFRFMLANPIGFGYGCQTVISDATAARLASDAVSDMLRDDLAEARRESAWLRLMFRAALDQLALATTDPERFAAKDRELRKAREEFIAGELCKDLGIRSATVDGGVSAPETTAADPCVRLRE